MLPKGSAKKVTIYLNQDVRAHLEPLWSAVLAFLRHKRIAGATLFRADAGFGSHEQIHDPRSEYISEHSSVRIEFIESAERVEELLPTLYEMVTDGLIAVQDVTVVKSVAKDGKPQPAKQKSLKRVVHAPAKLIRIYLGEGDRCEDGPLYEAIVRKLRMMDFSGATVYRGIMGYGAKGHTHKQGIIHLSRDLPIMISIVETVEKADDLIRIASEMMQDGIIVSSDVEMYHIAHKIPAAEGMGANERPGG